MKKLSSIAQLATLIMQLLAAIYGIWSELSPATVPFSPVPKGIGTGITVISATMLTVLIAVFIERARQDELRRDLTEITKKSGRLLRDISGRASLSIPFHERDFYSLWPAQVRLARNTIDVTHLGPTPPQNRHGKEEKEYFASLKDLYQSTRAHVRRVERLTDDKLPWIEKLVETFKGCENFSMRVFEDASKEEMPFAVSVCRIDQNFAWLIALAEHESTIDYRDVLLTGKESVDLVSRYFNSRLWSRSIPVITHGQIEDDWKQRLAARNGE